MVLETRKIEHVLCNCECRHSQTAFEALGELKKLKSELEQAEQRAAMADSNQSLMEAYRREAEQESARAEQAECELRLLRVEAEVAANAVKRAERENELLIRERDEAQRRERPECDDQTQGEKNESTS